MYIHKYITDRSIPNLKTKSDTHFTVQRLKVPYRPSPERFVRSSVPGTVQHGPRSETRRGTEWSWGRDRGCVST